GRKPRRADRALAKGQLPESGKWRLPLLSDEQAAQDEEGGSPEGSRETQERTGLPATDCRGLGNAALRKAITQHGEVASEVARRGVPLVGLLGEAALDEPPKRRRRLEAKRPHGLGLVVEDRRQRVDRVRAAECALPRQHLVEDRAEGELVRAKVERGGSRLLRRHVTHSSE